MEKDENFIIGMTLTAMAIVLTISLIANIWLMDKVKAQQDGTPVTDTIRVTRYDTLYCEMPVARDSVVVRYKTVLVPAVKTDTIKDIITAAWADSVLVEIPIEQKEYRDSTYKAYISGYDVRLDSIFVYGKTEYKTIAEKKRKDKRWHIGVSAGYGANKQGLSPFVGVGVTYSIFSF